MTNEELISKLTRERYYQEYVNYCLYEDHTKPVSFEEWDQHCDEKGYWVK